MFSSRSLVGISRLFCVLAIAILAGCASPEEKAQSFYEKGAELLKQEKYQEANLQFRNALQLNEDLAPAWLGMAKVELNQQNWRQAFGAFKRVTELDPANAEAHEEISRIMLYGGELDEALKYNNTAFELTPNRVQTLTLRSIIFLKLGDTEAALDLARKALEIDPVNAEGLLVLAAERQQAGDSAAALAIIDQGLETDPANVGMLVFKIRVFEQQKDLEGARGALLKLVEHYPDEKVYRRALVKYYVGKGETDAAEKEVRTIAERAPDDEEAQLDVIRFLNTYRGFDAARDELLRLIGLQDSPVRYELLLAQLQFREGQSDAAEERLRLLMQKQAGTEDGAAAKVMLAQMLLEQGRKDDTRALVAEILETDKDNVEALSTRARLAMDDGEFEAAINDLRAALNQQGQSAALKVQLGRALELNGSADLADENYAIAMRDSNFDSSFGLEYVRFLRRQGKIERAEEVMTELMSRNRPNAQTLTEMASIKLQRRDWEGAERIAEALKTVEADQGTASQILGVALSGQNRFDESIEVLSAAQSVQPDNAGSMLALVRTYLSSGKTAEAEAFLNEMVQSNPDNLQAMVMLGMVKSSDPARLAEAEAEFKAVIAKAPDSEVGYRALAGFYASQKRQDEAEAIASEGLEKLPDNIPLGLLMAGFLENKGEFEQAIAAYEKLYGIQPQSQIIANNLASLLSDHRDDEASLERAFRLASRLKSSDVAFFKDTLAWVHFRRGDTAVALDLLEDAVKALPEMPVVRYHLAQVLLKDGRKESARQEFQKALELDKSGSLPFRAEAESALAKLNAQ